MLRPPKGACIFGPRFFQQYAELLPGPVDPDAYAAIAEANWLEFIGPPLAVSDPLQADRPARHPTQDGRHRHGAQRLPRVAGPFQPRSRSPRASLT